MNTTMTGNHPSISHSAPATPDAADPWHVIREYNTHYSCEEFLRITIRRHLELYQSEFHTTNHK